MGPDPAGLSEIESIFSNVISVIVGLGFIALLVVVIVAGFKFLTSGGEPKALQAARYAATLAFAGVVLMAVAWLILQLIENFTGIPVTIFNIKALCGIGGTQFCPSPSP